MGDVKLAAQTHVSKTSLTVDHSRVSSMPLTEAPAFTLPPRNLCIKEGATAKFEGRVKCVGRPVAVQLLHAQTLQVKPSSRHAPLRDMELAVKPLTEEIRLHPGDGKH
uniref:Myosin light chain kinase n=1 Tax=Bos mutus grunniens TaxID=30521 RepID=A0A8B9X544_BOSMU